MTSIEPAGIVCEAVSARVVPLALACACATEPSEVTVSEVIVAGASLSVNGRAAGRIAKSGHPSTRLKCRDKGACVDGR